MYQKFPRGYISNNPVVYYLEILTNLSVLSEPGVPRHPQILVNQLTLSDSGRPDYAHHIITGTPGFSDLHTGYGTLYIIIKDNSCINLSLVSLYFSTCR
jgi:hypothetical protein